MRPSGLFFAWILLASAAASLSPGAELEVGKRQATVTSDPAATSSSDPAAASTSAAPAPATSATRDPTTSQAPAPASSPTGQSSSLGLLLTQTSSSGARVVTVTVAPQANNSDSNVAFVDSKYRQLIIALACISGALLLGLIATAVIAFRARADNDLLHDQLSRYEEGVDLIQRGGKGAGSSGSLGGYGRLSLHDPDSKRQSRRSMSESNMRPTSVGAAGRRLSGTPMGSGTPPGNRRVTFSNASSESGKNLVPASASASVSNRDSHSEYSLLFPPGILKSEEAPPEAQHPTSPSNSTIPPPPKPPAVRRISLMDNGSVRRLPTAPKSSNSGHETYTDPFAGEPTR